MKTNRLINRKVIITFTLSLVSLFAFSNFLSSVDKNDILRLTSSINDASDKGEIKKKNEVKIADTITEYSKIDNVTPKVIVYEGMTMQELSDKLNRSLKSNLAGKGELIANYSLSKGVDPYVATSIMLLETGCNWSCSGLVQKCNNVGGQKGSPNCSGGYRSYPTLDEGIMGMIDNLAVNYYAMGLTTPEAMNPKYAASTAWAAKVRNYMASISAK